MIWQFAFQIEWSFNQTQISLLLSYTHTGPIIFTAPIERHARIHWGRVQAPVHHLHGSTLAAQTYPHSHSAYVSLGFPVRDLIWNMGSTTSYLIVAGSMLHSVASLHPVSPGKPGSLTSKMQYNLAKGEWHVMELNCHRQPHLSQIILHPDTNCRRISGGHIAQVAFLPLECSGGSPLSPRGVPIDGPRMNVHASAVLFTIPNVWEGTLALQRRVMQMLISTVLQNHKNLDRRSWLLWVIAKTIQSWENILANNTSTLLWATLKKEIFPEKDLFKKY